MVDGMSLVMYSEIPGDPKGISESSHLYSQQSVKLLHTKIPGSLEPGFKFNFSNISKSAGDLIHK